jgi:hypothetical protein
MQYRIVDGREDMDGWLEYARAGEKKVVVKIPASWGDKRAALKVMQAGLAGLLMPEGKYRLFAGSEPELAAAIDRTQCMLLGLPILRTGTVEIMCQAGVEFSDTETQARETWGELIASRMRAHVAQPG